MNPSTKITEELNVIHNDYIEKVKEILIKEANLQGYKVGDILEDHYQIGRVEKVFISIDTTSRTFYLSYRCEKLTKKLVPFKSGEKTIVYGSNVEHKLN